MSIDDLRARLWDVPGSDRLQMNYLGGLQRFSIAGRFITVPAEATEADVEAAIRTAVSSPDISVRIPMVSPISEKPKGKPMAITGAGAAGLSLKQLMTKHKQLVDDAKTKLETNFAKLAQAAQGMDKLGDGVGAEADDLLASLAEFTNDTAGEAGGM